MNRYFFHVVSDDLNATDLVGVELRNFAAVRDHAEAKLTELWAQRVLAGEAPLTRWFEVIDQEERAVLTLQL